MLDDDEASELRRLRAGAFAPSGGLSGPDAARLAELEEKRVAEPEPAEPVGAPRHAQGALSTELAERGPRASEAPGGAQRRLEGSVGIEARGTAPRRIAMLTVAIAVALLIGLGVGRLLPHTPASAEAALTDAQRSWTESFAGDYDPGSIRAVAARDDVAAWSATRHDGEQICVVIASGADESSFDCALRHDALEGELIATQLATTTLDGPAVYSVSGMTTTNGDVAARIERHELPTAETAGFDSQYERNFALSLVDRGFVPESIHVGARDESGTYWVAGRMDGRYCLLVPNLPEMDNICIGPYGSGGPDAMGSSLSFDAGEGDEGKEFLLRFDPGGIPVLEITEG